MAAFLALCAAVLWPGSGAHAYSKPYVGNQKTYIAHEEDTLVHIARRYGLGYVEMRAANPHVDPWLPGGGTELVLPSRHLLPDAPRSGIVINLPEMRMYAFMHGKGAPPSTFALGIGREGLETPIGSTTVVRKADGPSWRPTARMRREDPTLPAVIHQGPDNPMGTHALYLGWTSYAIHGTNKPYGIGRRSSSGCLRLYPENISELYNITPVGTRVTVVNQPIKLAWIDDVLYMEAHPEMEQALQMEETGQVFASKMSDQDMALIVKAAGEFQDRLHWATIRHEVRNRSGVPIMIARKPNASISEPEFEVIDGRKLTPPKQPVDPDQIEYNPVSLDGERNDTGDEAGGEASGESGAENDAPASEKHAEVAPDKIKNQIADDIVTIELSDGKKAKGDDDRNANDSSVSGADDLAEIYGGSRAVNP